MADQCRLNAWRRCRDIIEAGEYDHYGIRVHRAAEVAVGDHLGNSFVWVDGERTDDELDGICALKITLETIDAIIERARREYPLDEGEPIVLVGGYYASHGQDRGEIIIKDNICLAVISPAH